MKICRIDCDGIQGRARIRAVGQRTDLLGRTDDQHSFSLIICKKKIATNLITMQCFLHVVSFDRSANGISMLQKDRNLPSYILNSQEATIILQYLEQSDGTVSERTESTLNSYNILYPIGSLNVED